MNNIKQSVMYAVLTLSVLCAGCEYYYYDDSHCKGGDRFEPFRSNSFIDVYSEEPSVRYLRTRSNGSVDTIKFKTRLDTLYLGWGEWSHCERCPSIFEVVQVQFLSDTVPFEMSVAFSSCRIGKAMVEGRSYDVYGSSAYWGETKFDSLLVNDSMGLQYYVRDSQYRLVLLP